MATNPPDQPPVEIPPEGPAEAPPPSELPPEPQRMAGRKAGRQMQGAGRPGGGGQSGGGAYPNPHSGKNARGDEAGDEEALTNHGYFGGGQAGAQNWSGSDHHAAARPKG